MQLQCSLLGYTQCMGQLDGACILLCLLQVLGYGKLNMRFIQGQIEDLSGSRVACTHAAHALHGLKRQPMPLLLPVCVCVCTCAVLCSHCSR